MGKVKQEKVAKFLMSIYDNPEMLSMWRDDPVKLLQEQGFNLEHLSPEQTNEYSEYLN